MKKYTLVFVALISLFTYSPASFGFTVNRMVWQLSDEVTNVYLYEKLIDAENHAKLNELSEAANILENLRNEKLSLRYILQDGEPLDLVLSSAILWYRAEKIKNIDPEIVKSARFLIDKWAKAAEGKRWKSFKFLFHRIRSYYVAIKNPKGRIEAQKEMMLYDPFDEEQVRSFDEYCTRFPESVGDIKKFLEMFKAKGGILTPKLELTLISLSELKQNDKFDAVIDWLKTRKNADMDTLKIGIEALLNLTSVENPESIKKTYNILTDLALWQPATEERMPVVALILNERAKIEAISPDSLK